MTDHAATALDQLRLADDRAETVAQQHAGFLAAANVHALLHLADAVRSAGIDLAVLPELHHTP